MSEKNSFWSTVPGILTGIAAIITAVGGLLVTFYQTGILSSKYDGQVAKEEVPIESAKSLNSQQTKRTDAALQDAPVEFRKDIAIDSDPASHIINLKAEKVNLLSSENGGQVLAATSDQWLKTIDGEEREFSFYESNLGSRTEAVYAFSDERPATFDTFSVLILGTQDSNLKDFELLWGNESAAGKFHLIGEFQTQNIKLFQTPYQEFRFSPVTAKYLKVRLRSTWVYALIDSREFQLMGVLK